MAQCEVLGAHYRADKLFPQYYRFWQDWLPKMPDDPDLGAQRYTHFHRLGGSVHVYFRNTGAESLAIEDVLFEELSLKRSLAFSDQRKVRKFANIRFSDLSEEEINRLIEAGEPVWFKADPQQILPGETGEVVVRLRHQPEVAQLRLGLKHADGTQQVTIPVRSAEAQVAQIAFSRNLDRVWLYFRRSDAPGEAPTKIIMDGRDVTRFATIVSDEAVDLVPVEIRLSEPLKPCSVHCFQGVYKDGSIASASTRAWADEIAYGMWGALPVKESQMELARGHIEDLVQHNINLQMPQVASSGVRQFYKSEAGQRYCKSVGLRKTISDPGKLGTKDPFMYFLKDEPDCADNKMEGVASDKKIGGLAKWVVGSSHDLRDKDPETPQFLNVDNTFRPENWYTYGQLPDILSIDPYSSPRIMGSYWRNPNRLWLYVKNTFVYGSARVAFSACEPKPLHVILSVFRRIESERKFRFPTPIEKRIEVYYSLAGGAKGISYWWFVPGSKPRPDKGAFDGLGSARSDPGAAKLWNEIGLLGAELRTAGPVIIKSCPVEIETKVSKSMLWPKCLLAGLDTMVLLVMNEQYANDRVGTVYVPIDDATVTVELPTWLEATSVFEINHKGTQDIVWKVQDSALEVDLGTVDLTRMVVITKDAQLRTTLQKLHKDKFADNVAKLIKSRPTAQ